MEKNTQGASTHQTGMKINPNDPLMEVISRQSKDIDFLEKKINSLYIWLSLVGFAASMAMLLLIYKP
jgi:hypothetical protein